MGNRMKFMHSRKEEEERKRHEKDQLRHLEDMQWVIPGFEAEVAQADAAKDIVTLEAKAPPPLLLHRRSYKGFNPTVESAMKATIAKHAKAVEEAKELEQ